MGVKPIDQQIIVAGWASDPPGRQEYLVLDGQIGPKTHAAIRRFQAGHGLAVTGVADPQTEVAMRAQTAPDTTSVNFTWGESYSKNGDGHSGGKVSENEVRRNVRRHMHQLQGLRKKLGDRPITINSWFRSVRHNATVGGASNSQHMYGICTDIRVAGVSLRDVYNMAKSCGFSGMYIGSSFVHLDQRAAYPYGSRRWWWGDG